MRRWPTKRYAHAHAQDMHTHKSVQFASTSGQCNILPQVNHSSNSGHAQPTQTRLPHSNRPKQNRPCTIKFKPNKPKPNQFQMVRCTSIRPTPGRFKTIQCNSYPNLNPIQDVSYEIRPRSFGFKSSVTATGGGVGISAMFGSQNAQTVGHGGPQKEMHIHKIGHFGPHTCTLAQDRPVRPTEVIDTHKISTG